MGSRAVPAWASFSHSLEVLDTNLESRGKARRRGYAVDEQRLHAGEGFLGLPDVLGVDLAYFSTALPAFIQSTLTTPSAARAWMVTKAAPRVMAAMRVVNLRAPAEAAPTAKERPAFSTTGPFIASMSCLVDIVSTTFLRPAWAGRGRAAERRVAVATPATSWREVLRGDSTREGRRGWRRPMTFQRNQARGGVLEGKQGGRKVT